MHAAEFFNILAQFEHLDFIDGFSEAIQKNQFKRIFISSIIATDMGRHNKLA
jgi:3'5'-cyclic nucleotide phosphodiesterase